MPTVKATVTSTLSKAASYIGVKGCPNEFTRWYSNRHGMSPSSVFAWCATFVSYILYNVGISGFSDSASAAGVANQFKRVNSPKKGDIVTFNWDGRADQNWCDHIGFVESVNGSTFITIEGNTGNVYGGEVARVVRSTNYGYFCAFYRPTYSQPALKTPTISVRDYHGTWRGPTKNGVAGAYGTNIAYVVTNAVGGNGYRVKPHNGSWLSYIFRNDKKDLDYGAAGDGRAINGLEITDPRIDFRIHQKGVKYTSGKNKGKMKWSAWRQGGTSAGKITCKKLIDKIQIRLHQN